MTAPEFGKWLPIETAPQDRTEILAWRKDCGILLVRWDAPINFLTDSECDQLGDSCEESGWFCSDFVSGSRLDCDEVPTHWMPLPPAPEVKP